MASPFTPPSIPGAAGAPLGLTGATAATRYVGATASGAPASGTFAVGDFVIDQTGKIFVCTVAGSPGTWVQAGGTRDSNALISDTKAATTEGGGFTSGAWQTRVLQTEDYDPDGIVSIAANQFTLQAGTYRLYARAPAFDCNAHKARLQNITDATTTLVGSAEWSDTTGNVENDSVIAGRFTIAGAKAFEIQHQCGVTKATNGMGAAAGFSAVEVYTQVWITKEAA